MANLNNKDDNEEKLKEIDRNILYIIEKYVNETNERVEDYSNEFFSSMTTLKDELSNLFKMYVFSTQQKLNIMIMVNIIILLCFFGAVFFIIHQ